MSLYKLAERKAEWESLEEILEKRQSELTVDDSIDFARLYRSVCTDLSLARASHLPEQTVHYLHELVGRAHAAFYGTQRVTLLRWRELFLNRIPLLMFRNRFLRIASALFWVPFILSCVLAFVDSVYAESVLGPMVLAQMDAMYADPLTGRDIFASGSGTSFYIFHNVSIALQCFASGLLLGIGSVYALIYNGVYLGTVFGYMLSGPHAVNFGTFVMAHGPLELTGVCVAGAAGLRMGFSMIETGGETRIRSLQLAMKDVLAMVALSAVMIAAAAFLEGFVSPSSLPVGLKAAVMIVCAVLIALYFQLPRFGRR